MIKKLKKSKLAKNLQRKKEAINKSLHPTTKNKISRRNQLARTRILNQQKKWIKRGSIVLPNLKILVILKVKNNLRIPATLKNQRIPIWKRRGTQKQIKNSKVSKSSRRMFKMLLLQLMIPMKRKEIQTYKNMGNKRISKKKFSRFKENQVI